VAHRSEELRFRPIRRFGLGARRFELVGLELQLRGVLLELLVQHLELDGAFLKIGVRGLELDVLLLEELFPALQLDAGGFGRGQEPLPLDHRRRERTRRLDQIELARGRRPRLIVVHRERAETLAIRGKDGCRPTRAKTQRQRERPKVHPELVGGNIGHDRCAPMECRGAAGADGRTDAQPINGVTIRLC